MTEKPLSIGVVEFKSLPQFFERERDGRKPNTVREIEYGDSRKTTLDTWEERQRFGKVRIRNSLTDETFERQVQDVAILGELYIISWRHEDGK